MKMGFDQAVQVDAVVDFVQRSYDVVETDAARDLSTQVEEQRAELNSQLDKEIDHAREQKQLTQEKLLRQLKAGLNSVRPGEKPDPKLLKQLEAGKGRLANADGFGTESRLPKVVDETLGFLGTLLGEPAKSKPAGKAETKPADAKTEARADQKTEAKTEAKAGPAGQPLPAGVERRVATPPDPRIRQFVARFYADGFEKKEQFSEAELASALPEAQRKEFLAMPKDQREFLLSLDDKHQGAYAQMDHGEQQLFRSLKPQERGQYIAMNHDERAFFQKLDPGERATYLTLHPDQRELIRQKGGEAKALLGGGAQAKAMEGKDPAQVAKEFGSELLEVLGHELPKEGELNQTQRELLDKAGSLATNYLKEFPGNFAMAKTATLKALIENPDFTDKMLKDVQSVLLAKDQERGISPGSQNSYVSHFRKIRSLVMGHAQRLLQPGVTREQLLGGMAQAVEISAEFQIAHPPRRRALRLTNPNALEARVYG